MSYVGTPHALSSPQQTIASIIEGEAGNQGLLGMQAVGAVIANRAASGFGGYGNDLLSQALAPNQFQGQSSPSQMAMNVAGDVLAGNNPDPTGGALFYANPGSSSASWAQNLNSSNSLQIGDHFFTDNQQGIPFFGNGQSSPTDQFSGLTDAQLSDAGFGQLPTDTIGTTVGSDSSGMTLQSDNSSLQNNDLSQFQVQGVNAPLDWSKQNVPGVNQPIGSGEVGTQAPSGNDQYSQPNQNQLEITNADAIGQAAADTISKAATNLNQGIQQTGQTEIAAGTTWLDSFFGTLKEAFIRSSFVVLGLVVLAGAFLLYYADENMRNAVDV